jgi:hypothetical protein
MTTSDPVQEYKALVAAEVAVLVTRTDLVHEPYEPPAAWVAQAILDAVHREDLAIRAHVCPNKTRQGVAYEGPLSLTVDGWQRHLHPYWTKSKARRSRMFAQEASVSVAMAARLAGEFEYAVSLVQVEADGCGVDVEAFDGPGFGARALLGVEAKVSDREIDAMVAGIKECGGVGGVEAHARGIQKAQISSAYTSRLDNHHKKCEWLCTARPVAFWAVSLDAPMGCRFSRFPIARASRSGTRTSSTFAGRALRHCCPPPPQTRFALARHQAEASRIVTGRSLEFCTNPCTAEGSGWRRRAETRSEPTEVV